MTPNNTSSSPNNFAIVTQNVLPLHSLNTHHPLHTLCPTSLRRRSLKAAFRQNLSTFSPLPHPYERLSSFPSGGGAAGEGNSLLLLEHHHDTAGWHPECHHVPLRLHEEHNSHGNFHRLEPQLCSLLDDNLLPPGPGLRQPGESRHTGGGNLCLESISIEELTFVPLNGRRLENDQAL